MFDFKIVFLSNLDTFKCKMKARADTSAARLVLSSVYRSGTSLYQLLLWWAFLCLIPLSPLQKEPVAFPAFSPLPAL